MMCSRMRSRWTALVDALDCILVAISTGKEEWRAKVCVSLVPMRLVPLVIEILVFLSWYQRSIDGNFSLSHFQDWT